MTVNGLEVTDIIIFPIKQKIKDNKLLAFARVIINDQFIINGIRIFEGDSGNPFIKYPEEYNKSEKTSYDICYPITSELRTYISDQVLSQYNIAIITY